MDAASDTPSGGHDRGSAEAPARASITAADGRHVAVQSEQAKHSVRTPDVRAGPATRPSLRPYAAALALWAAVLLVHLVAPSAVNSDQWAWKTGADARIERIQAIIDSHADRSVFQKRVLTTMILRGIDAGLGDVRWSYVALEFSLLLATALLLVRIGRELGLDDHETMLSQLLFFASHTIFFWQFTPVNNYDEPIQFVVFYLALWCMIRRPARRVTGWGGCAVGPLLLATLIGRETALLLLPGLVVFVGEVRKRVEPVHLFAVAAAVAAYFVFLRVFGYTLNDPQRIPSVLLRLNFGTRQAAIESLLGIFVSLGMAGVVALYYWRQHRGRLTRVDKAALGAFAVTLCVNVPVVFVSAISSEVRQLALPLVFVWPVAGRWLVRLLALREHRGATRLLWRYRWDLIKALLIVAVVFGFYEPRYLTKLYQSYAAAFLLGWLAIHRETRRDTWGWK